MLKAEVKKVCDLSSHFAKLLLEKQLQCSENDSASLLNLKSNLDKLVNRIQNPNTPKETSNLDHVKNDVNENQADSTDFNIVIHGLKLNGTDVSSQIIQFFKSSLTLDLDVKQVKHLNKKFKKSTILVTLYSIKDKLTIFKNCHKLKHQNLKVTIVEDLTLEERNERKKLIPILKWARALGKKAYLRGPNLFIDRVLWQEFKQNNADTELAPIPKKISSSTKCEQKCKV